MEGAQLKYRTQSMITAVGGCRTSVIKRLIATVAWT